VAVAAFLSNRIPWSTIAEVVAGTLDRYDAPVASSPGSSVAQRTVEDVLEADAEARRLAELVVAGREAAA
jgi:1-deoxy-D-xylulose 5-phosphate reductoisomerase